MNKPFVKLIPDKNVKDITLPSDISFEGNVLTMSLENSSFNTGELFDVIIEEGNQLKFMRASLMSLNENKGVFEVNNIRFAIKREYERIPWILNVNGFNFPAQTTNISAGGMQVKTQKKLDANKVYDLAIDYVSKKIPIKYQVLKVNGDRNDFSISGKFVDLDKESRAFIIQQNLKCKLSGLRSSSFKTTFGGENE